MVLFRTMFVALFTCITVPLSANAEPIHITCKGDIALVKDGKKSIENASVDVSINPETGAAEINNIDCFLRLSQRECTSIDAKITSEKVTFSGKGDNGSFSSEMNIELDRYAGVLNVTQEAWNNTGKGTWVWIKENGRLPCEKQSKRF